MLLVPCLDPLQWLCLLPTASLSVASKLITASSGKLPSAGTVRYEGSLQRPASWPQVAPNAVLWFVLQTFSEDQLKLVSRWAQILAWYPGLLFSPLLLLQMHLKKVIWTRIPIPVFASRETHLRHTLLKWRKILEVFEQDLQYMRNNQFQEGHW